MLKLAKRGAKEHIKSRVEVDIDVLWKNYSQGKENGDGVLYRNKLIEFYLPIVEYTAKRIYVKLPDKVEIEDLISAGVFGLRDAIEEYDSERGTKFETYSSKRIRGSMLDELRRMDWVPRLIRARTRQLNNARTSLESSLGHSPTEQEIAEYLGMNSKDFNRLKRDANALKLIPLNNNENYEIPENYTLIDALANPKSQDPTIEAQKKDLKYMLTKGLSRAERLIIILYYYEEMTMKEIGATLELDESRVSQLHSNIIRRTRARLSSKYNLDELVSEFVA